MIEQPQNTEEPSLREVRSNDGLCVTLPAKYRDLTPQERKQVREKYAVRQDGNCAHCGGSLNSSPAKSITSKPIKRHLFPPNFFKWPVHLHHCHKTGLTIGAVHSYCNAVLWQYHGQ